MVDRLGVNVEQRTAQKVCGRCREALPLDAYTPSQALRGGSYCRACTAEYRRERRRAGVDECTSRVATHCGRCGTSLEGLRADARFCSSNCADQAWRKANPDRVRRWHWKNVYGITDEQRLAMFADQGDACAICRKTEAKQWHVDHCHATGRVRGILCGTCNHALGMFHDNVDKLTAAIAYLQRAATN